MPVARRTRRLLAVAAGVVVVLLIVLALLPEPVPVDLGVVDRGPLEVVVRHEGRARVVDRFEITAPVDGTVRRIDLRPGDRVVAGKTVLATIRPLPVSPLDERARRDAEAAVRAAEADVARAAAERDRLAAEAGFASDEQRRAETLFDQRVVSERDRDQARSRARAAREALAAGEAALVQARAALDAARARLLAPGSPGGARPVVLRSPIDGVVLQRFRESAGPVAAGTPLLELADTSRLEIWADFLSTDAVRFEPGMRAVIDGWGGPPLEARVRRVEPHAFLKISALGVEEQRTAVLLDFVDPAEAWRRLADGYRVQVGVVVEELAETLRVPASALFREGEGWAVFRVEGRRAKLVPVEIGPMNGLHAAVRGGLAEGDRVVLHPSDAVRDGARVRARTSATRR